jgi:hypothetical protein
MKKIAFGGKPSVASGRLSPDEWVNDREEGEPIKRLTIDVPLGLHKRIKSQCAVQGVKMADVVREMLEQRFAADATGEGPVLHSAVNPEKQKIVSS